MPQHSMGFDSGLSPIGKQPRFGATSGLAVIHLKPRGLEVLGCTGALAESIGDLAQKRE
jgi:hypothetical protein